MHVCHIRVPGAVSVGVRPREAQAVCATETHVTKETMSYHSFSVRQSTTVLNDVDHEVSQELSLGRLHLWRDRP